MFHHSYSLRCNPGNCEFICVLLDFANSHPRLDLESLGLIAGTVSAFYRRAVVQTEGLLRTALCNFLDGSANTLQSADGLLPLATVIKDITSEDFGRRVFNACLKETDFLKLLIDQFSYHSHPSRCDRSSSAIVCASPLYVCVRVRVR